MRYFEIIGEESGAGSGLLRPKRPLKPVQAQYRTERQNKIEQDIRDTQDRAVERVAKLRSKFHDI